MSTITRERVKDILEFGAGRIISPITDDEIRELARIALASLEADKEYKHHSVIAEQLAHVLSSMDATDHQRAVISCAVDRLNNVSQLLQSSPSALLVPDTLDYQGAKELYNYLMNEEETNATVNGWNACRDAMIQGAEPVSNRDELPDGWVACSERMPEEGQEVIVMDVARGKVQSGMIYEDGCFVDFSEQYYEVENPSHWMPLPAAPKQEVK